MSIRVWLTTAVLCGAVATLGASQQRGTGRGTTAKTPSKTAPATPPSIERRAACANSLGEGVTLKRPFCDVIIAATGADSVSMEIPPHTGPATLYFDLHPRFEVSQPDGDAAKLYQHQTAVVAIVGPTGDVIDRVATEGEFRSTADLVDRLPGEAKGTFKVVGPGKGRTIKVTIPANVSAVGIVGLRVEIQNRFNLQAFPEPGRPVAIVSNWRIEYTPR